MFTLKTAADITILDVYVDDIIVTGSSFQHIQSIETHLHDTFSIKDMRILHYFLGIEIAYLPNGIVMSRTKFTKELLQAV